LKSTFESDAETFRVDNRIIKAKRFLFLIILGFTCFFDVIKLYLSLIIYEGDINVI